MNAKQVAEAFARGQIGSGSNIMSTGDRVYSYQLLIAKRVRGKVKIVSVASSPSRTTSKHIGVVTQAVTGATIVDKL